MSAASTSSFRRPFAHLLLLFGTAVFVLFFVGLGAQGQLNCFQGSTDPGESYCGILVGGAENRCVYIDGACVPSANNCNPAGGNGWSRIENPIDPWPICDGPYYVFTKECSEGTFSCGDTINYQDDNCVFTCGSNLQWAACAAINGSDPCS